MKRIIAFSVALVLFVSLFAVSFSVLADDEPIMTNQEYYAAQSYLIAKYKDGDISYSEFQERTQAVTDEFVTNNTVGGVLQAGALNASNTFNAVSQKIGSTVQKYGDSAKDYISDYISNLMNSYTVLSDKPTTSTDGYGAVLKCYIGGGLSLIDYCDYLILREDDHYQTVNIRKQEYYRYGSVESTYVYKQDGVSQDFERYSSSETYCLVYGDVRYSTGEQAPTDDEYETISDYDFSKAPERELEDLLKKILDEMELKEPDLSTMEGLLKAIYARLGTLDSDNDNALLSSINSAVLALLKSNDDNNEALLEELLKFRDDLKKGTVGTDTNLHGHEISGTLYNVIPLDKNWLNKIFHDKENLKVQYEGKTYYLENCGCLKLDDKFYTPNMNYDSYSKFDYDFSNENDDINHIVKLSDENTSIFDIDFGSINDLIPSYDTRRRNISTFSLSGDRNFFDNILTHSQNRKIDGILGYIEDFIAMGVPYESIQENLAVYEEIIFNDYTPKDLTFTIFDTDVVLLRYSDFITDVGNETTSYTEPIAIVRAFSSILIGFFWVFSMYKKLSNLV